MQALGKGLALPLGEVLGRLPQRAVHVLGHDVVDVAALVGWEESSVEAVGEAWLGEPGGDFGGCIGVGPFLGIAGSALSSVVRSRLAGLGGTLFFGGAGRAIGGLVGTAFLGSRGGDFSGVGFGRLPDGHRRSVAGADNLGGAARRIASAGVGVLISTKR